ncbi:hypothetical protein TrLO_g10630 [Triparma laevis f. longispina]|uniref:Uncharacterized protein n=1 Tax=Triparma laevis f. longispina TaxID=1714387 RepID=A0A9W7CFQ7_9STRA|nr:hypothetical protein TrLO_g10630 [Triparma laevis f. longispina]
MSDITAPLSKLNYVNLVAYAINVLFTYGIGVAGLFGLPDNTVLSEKYQTLVTPIGWAFSIWGPIFISEAVFTLAQLLPTYRSNPIVVDGVGYWYAAVCIAQIFWTMSFSFEVNWLAFIFMFTILGFLAKLVFSSYKLVPENNRQYWLFKFPFELHFGWIIAASFVNFSVLFVAYGDEGNYAQQLSVAVLSLAGVAAVAMYLLFVIERPLVTTGGVGAWALGGIAAQLTYPFQKTQDAFGSIILNGLVGASGFLSIVFAVVVGLNILYLTYKNCFGGMVMAKNGDAMTRKLSAPLTGLETI